MSRPKNKIINDPIYGFITIPFDIIWQLIEHPLFQRLRRISQLGLSSLVYPGANHNRFHHAIGAMHLMNCAIQTLKSKDIQISTEEHKASLIAILLHDIGHGPFSHALESTIVNNISHEEISLLFMQELNDQFTGKLSLAIDIFKKKYKKKFLCQLVSSQLDVDRLDYLNRDSFYSGVNEGIINCERIITMLNVYNNELVVDYKGIHSIEKFIIARKLMYWQVYLHKTVLSAEHTLMGVLKRAKELTRAGRQIFTTKPFSVFLNEKQEIDLNFFKKNNLIHAFSQLDDIDILSAIKEWCHEDDKVLSLLSNKIIKRELLKITYTEKPSMQTKLISLREKAMRHLNINQEDVNFLVFPLKITKETYNFIDDEIILLQKDNSTIKLSEIKNTFHINSRNSKIIKHYICYPKECLID